MPQSACPISLTAALGVQGWSHLDAVLLAALATESPLLLVGPHGTAKSLLIERLALALGLQFRHYNAALLNYDDLVGIPMPDASGKHLRFVTTPGAIWDAAFVFFDEISRCRPDLQNKLFPIVHERRVAGLQLEALRHRWAAMNPPAPDDIDDQASTYYLGSEPLDPALADRFPFIVPVPDWKQLSKADRHLLVSGKAAETSEPSVALVDLTAACRDRIPLLESVLSERLADYIVCVMDQLYSAGLPQSPRRARTLARAVLAVHAARLTLDDHSCDLSRSAELALLYGLPQNATEVPPSMATVIAAHKQAWEVSGLIKDSAWRQVLEEPDPVRRVLLGDQLNLADEDLARLVTQALGAESSEARRLGLAVTLFLTFRERRDLTPAAWEPLAQLSRRVMEPRAMSDMLPMGRLLDTWREINAWLATQTDTPRARLERNYVLGGFPDLWKRYDWQASLDAFRADLAQFQVEMDRV